MTDEELAKLPAWARKRFIDMERERNTAVKQLLDYEAEQTPSDIWTDDLISDGTAQGPRQSRKYLQGCRVTFQLSNKRKVRISMNDDRVHVSMDDSVLIRCLASNCFELKGDR